MKKDMDWRRPSRCEVVEAICVRRSPTVAVFALPSGERIKCPIDLARDLRTNDKVALSRDWSREGRVVHADRIVEPTRQNKALRAAETK